MSSSLHYASANGTGASWSALPTIPQATPPLSSLLAASDYPPIADFCLPKRGFPTISKKIGTLSAPESANFPPPLSLPISSAKSIQVLSEQNYLNQRVLPPPSLAAEFGSPPFPPLRSSLFKSMVGLDSVHQVISPIVSPCGVSAIENFETAPPALCAHPNLNDVSSEIGAPEYELSSSEGLEQEVSSGVSQISQDVTHPPTGAAHCYRSHCS